MKFTVERNWIDVLGMMWMPSVPGAMRIDLDARDLEAIGEPTRANVDRWLALHSGDFQWVIDYNAVVGDVHIPWSSEENEGTFCDCVYGVEA